MRHQRSAQVSKSTLNFMAHLKGSSKLEKAGNLRALNSENAINPNKKGLPMSGAVEDEKNDRWFLCRAAGNQFSAE